MAFPFINEPLLCPSPQLLKPQPITHLLHLEHLRHIRQSSNQEHQAATRPQPHPIPTLPTRTNTQINELTYLGVVKSALSAFWEF